jgi:hypothetical protein
MPLVGAVLLPCASLLNSVTPSDVSGGAFACTLA